MFLHAQDIKLVAPTTLMDRNLVTRRHADPEFTRLNQINIIKHLAPQDAEKAGKIRNGVTIKVTSTRKRRLFLRMRTCAGPSPTSVASTLAYEGNDSRNFVMRRNSSDYVARRREPPLLNARSFYQVIQSGHLLLQIRTRVVKEEWEDTFAVAIGIPATNLRTIGPESCLSRIRMLSII